MANSNRRYLDNEGNQFMPLNAGGTNWNENFLNGPKTAVLVLILGSLVLIIIALASENANLFRVLFFIGLWIVISSILLRYVVFEEKFYYNMYKKLKNHEIGPPSIFWKIASIRNTPDGAILNYIDGKIGVIVRLDRDTITGKDYDFVETHYDAISDFYKSLCRKKYSFMQMNIMEKAGNDPRLDDLSRLVNNCDNPNMSKLVEKEIGYIRNITNKTLYESDYFLIYTSELNKLDYILNDVIDSLYKILDGAYIGYSILGTSEIIDLVKELYGVKYFNYVEATLGIYQDETFEKPFKISRINYTDGNYIDLQTPHINLINSLTSDIINGTKKESDVSFHQALDKIKINNFNNFSGVDLDNVRVGTQNNLFKNIKNNKLSGLSRANKNVKQNNQSQDFGNQSQNFDNQDFDNQGFDNQGFDNQDFDLESDPFDGESIF